jgi:hypothetical protein
LHLIRGHGTYLSGLHQLAFAYLIGHSGATELALEPSHGDVAFRYGGERFVAEAYRPRFGRGAYSTSTLFSGRGRSVLEDVPEDQCLLIRVRLNRRLDSHSGRVLEEDVRRALAAFLVNGETIATLSQAVIELSLFRDSTQLAAAWAEIYANDPDRAFGVGRRVVSVADVEEVKETGDAFTVLAAHPSQSVMLVSNPSSADAPKTVRNEVDFVVDKISQKLKQSSGSAAKRLLVVRTPVLDEAAFHALVSTLDRRHTLHRENLAGICLMARHWIDSKRFRWHIFGIQRQHEIRNGSPLRELMTGVNGAAKSDLTWT